MVRFGGVENGFGDPTTIVGHAAGRHSGRFTVGDPLDHHYLLVFEDDAPRVFELPANRTVMLGRCETASLRLLDSSVSRQHASIARSSGRTHVVDLASQNGTLVNGERIDAPRPLVPGDRLTVGAVTLIYHATAIPSPRAIADPLPAFRTIELGDRVAIIADPEMARLYQLVERLAPTELPVLVCGETGTGKEVAARALHRSSRRGARPLVSLNCASIQETLVESELFGYERGAFSGAVAAKPGLLEAASGGTVFLDEVGELPPAVQAKLLRVLETKRLLRLGDVRERAIDIRIVAATNRDLANDVAVGRFRQDLFFRLSAATLQLPPLRDRPRELPILAQIFLREACMQTGRAPIAISPPAIRRLLAHAWPGNVRELKHVMEYLAATLAGEIVEPWHLDERLLRSHRSGWPVTPPPPHEPPALPEPPQFRPLVDEIRELERTRIAAALAAAGGNQRAAARMLGMPLRTFVFKLRHYGLRRSDEPREVARHDQHRRYLGLRQGAPGREARRDVRARTTSIAYTGANTGVFSSTAPLRASIVDELGQPVVGASVAFNLAGGLVGTAQTDASGNASRAQDITLDAGAYPVSATFLGTLFYTGGTAGGSFTVTRMASSVQYTGATSGISNKTVTLSAKLTDALGRPLDGKLVTFTLGAQTASATTGAGGVSGVATTTLKLNQHNGSYSLTTAWLPAGGDTTKYTGASTSTTFVVGK